MPDKTLRMTLADSRRDRPVMLAIAGDSAAGKTTLTQGLVDTLGADRITSICVDDYPVSYTHLTLPTNREV